MKTGEKVEGRSEKGMGNIKFIIGMFIVVACISSSASALTMQESVDIALKNNPQITAAKENLNAASAKMGQAASIALPNVTIDASKGKSYMKPVVMTLPPSMGGGTISTAPDEPSDLTTYSLTLRQTLFTGGKVLQALTMARIGYDIAGENLKKAKNDVAYNVKSAYFNVLKAKKSLEVIDLTIKRMERQEKLVEMYYRSGLASRPDLLMVQTQVANMQVARIGAQGGLDIALLALQSVMGTKSATKDNISDEDIADDVASLPDREKILALAYANKPEWRSFELGLKTAKEALSYAYSGYFPDIAFMLSAGRTKSEYNVNTLYNTDLDNWRSLLVASWPIFDGLNTQNKIREAYASYNGAKAQEQLLKDAVTLEIDSAIITYNTSKAKLAASKIAADLAQRSLDQSEVAYKAGVISSLNYLDAQISNNDAQNSLWSAKYDLENAKASLNKSVGTKVL